MLTIARRFNGPPHSGNGGYVSGMLAQLVLEEFGPTPGAKVEVTLRKPPPLEKPLTVRQPAESESLQLVDGTTVVAAAELVEAAGELIEPVSYEEAAAAAKGYAGLSGHPFLTASCAGRTTRPGCTSSQGLCRDARTWSRLRGRPRTTRWDRSSCGPRWTAPAAGRPATWPDVRWCWGG